MNIVIYTKSNCNWCVKAKELMNKLHLKYEEKMLDVDYTRSDLFQIVYGHETMTLPLTVPQIFVDDHRVGGYEDFVEYCDAHGMTDE